VAYLFHSRSAWQHHCDRRRQFAARLIDSANPAGEVRPALRGTHYTGLVTYAHTCPCFLRLLVLPAGRRRSQAAPRRGYSSHALRRRSDGCAWDRYFSASSISTSCRQAGLAGVAERHRPQHRASHGQLPACGRRIRRRRLHRAPPARRASRRAGENSHRLPGQNQRQLDRRNFPGRRRRHAILVHQFEALDARRTFSLLRPA